MTRSERARWTDLQVLAYLASIELDEDPFTDPPLTTREVEAAVGLSHGRATRSVDRLMRDGLIDRDKLGLHLRYRGWDALACAGFDAETHDVITYPRDTEAA